MSQGGDLLLTRLVRSGACLSATLVKSSFQKFHIELGESRQFKFPQGTASKSSINKLGFKFLKELLVTYFFVCCRLELLFYELNIY